MHRRVNEGPTVRVIDEALSADSGRQQEAVPSRHRRVNKGPGVNIIFIPALLSQTGEDSKRLLLVASPGEQRSFLARLCPQAEEGSSKNASLQGRVK